MNGAVRKKPLDERIRIAREKIALYDKKAKSKNKEKEEARKVSPD